MGGTQPDRSLQQASRQATVACHPHIASHSHSRSPLFIEFQQHSKGIQPSFFLFLGRSFPSSSFIQRPCFNNVYCTLSTSFITFICCQKFKKLSQLSKFVKISPNLIEAFICFNLSNIYFNMSPRKEFIVLLMAFLALLNVLSEKCYSSKSFCVE